MSTVRRSPVVTKPRRLALSGDRRIARRPWPTPSIPSLEGDRGLVGVLALLFVAGVGSRLAPVAAIAVDGVVLAVLVATAVAADVAPRRAAAVALALVPLIRIVVFATAVGEPTALSWVLTGVPLLAAGVLAARALDLPLRRWLAPPRREWRRQAAVALAGPPLGLAGFAVGAGPQPDLPGVAPAGIAILLIAMAALPEELALRGVVQHAAGDLLGAPRRGIMPGALASAAIWVAFATPAALVFAVCTSVLFGWCVWRTGSLVGVILARGLMLGGIALVWPVVLGS
jgi:membrane protease YdiL (CAAX protease family)